MSEDEIKVNQARSVAVDQNYYWKDMSTCPVGVKVQLLNPGRVAFYGTWNGRDTWQLGWAPLPKIKEKP